MPGQTIRRTAGPRRAADRAGDRTADRAGDRPL